NSMVQVRNDYANQTSTDVVFSGSVAVSSDSRLDINGVELWVNGNHETALDNAISQMTIVDSTIGLRERLDAQFMPAFGATVVRKIGNVIVGACANLISPGLE